MNSSKPSRTHSADLVREQDSKVSLGLKDFMISLGVVVAQVKIHLEIYLKNLRSFSAEIRDKEEVVDSKQHKGVKT